LLGNPTTDSRFRITLEREGRPGLKLCKSPGAESTVEKKKKQIGTSSFVMKLYFTFIPVPREKQLDRMMGEGDRSGSIGFLVNDTVQLEVT